MQWISDKLPTQNGTYYCKAKIDGDNVKLPVNFDLLKGWDDAYPYFDNYTIFDIISWLDESPSPKEKELREALEKIIKECKLGVVHTSGQYIKSIATEALKQ